MFSVGVAIATDCVPFAIVKVPAFVHSPSAVFVFKVRELMALVVTASIVKSIFVMALSIAALVVIEPTKAFLLEPILMYAHLLLLLLALTMLTVNPSFVADHVDS